MSPTRQGSFLFLLSSYYNKQRGQVHSLLMLCIDIKVIGEDEIKIRLGILK
jgi:hypothetical protein